MGVISKSRQWLGDIAVRYAGSLDALFSIAQANGISITENLENGQALAVNDVESAAVVSTFEVENIDCATADSSGLQGIGYSAIPFSI